MSHVLVWFALFGGCGGKVALGDESVVVEADLGDPYVGIVAAVASGYLNTTCSIGIDLYEVGQDTPAVSVSVDARGGEWAGTLLEGDVQYTATASWSDCVPGSSGDGTFDSSTFSGVEGDLFLFRYNGVSAAFEALAQREDFEGGIATVTFDETSTATDVQTLAAELGVEADLVTSDSREYEVTWSDTTAVGEVLGWFSADDLYFDGAPVWIRQPEWW